MSIEWLDKITPTYAITPRPPSSGDMYCPGDVRALKIAVKMAETALCRIHDDLLAGSVSSARSTVEKSLEMLRAGEFPEEEAAYWKEILEKWRGQLEPTP